MPEIEELIRPEEEKMEMAQPEPIHEVTIEPEATPVQIPSVSEIQAATEQNATPAQEPEPAPTSPDSTQNNMVYVPGFGWLESQGSNEYEYAEDMYENGNKIGSMG